MSSYWWMDRAGMVHRTKRDALDVPKEAIAHWKAGWGSVNKHAPWRLWLLSVWRVVAKKQLDEENESKLEAFLRWVGHAKNAALERSNAETGYESKYWAGQHDAFVRVLRRLS